MSSLLLDEAETEKTWTAIQGRIDRSPTFQVVPEAALELIESVIMRNHDEAYDRWSTFTVEDQKRRVQFWKECVRDAVPADKAGIFAVYYHEYIASLERARCKEFEDEDGLMPIPSYGGHARAAHDAWVACTASLD